MNTPSEIKTLIDELLLRGEYQQAAALVLIEFEREPNSKSYLMLFACTIQDMAENIVSAFSPAFNNAVESANAFSEALLGIGHE